MNRDILVLRGGAIGDFVLTVPVLEALRRAWPRDRLTLVAQPRLGRLALACGLADRHVSLDTAAVSRLFVPGAAGETDFGPLRDAELAVCLLHDPDGVVRANLAAGGRRRVAALDPVTVTGHAADYLAGVLAPLGLAPPQPCVPRLRPCASAGAPAPFVAGQPRPVVLLHPGSGSARKNWPAERFAELARRLADEDRVTPLFVVGEADADAGQVVARLAPRAGRVPPCDLPRLAEELAAADAYVGNDAGITHLAAALGVPTLALFGPTDPAVWGPRGPSVRSLAPARPRADMAYLPVIDVFQALRSILAERAARAMN